MASTRKNLKKSKKVNEVEHDTIVNTRDIARLKQTVDSLQQISSGDLHYTHVQTGAASVWTVAHNLGKYPSVMVSDSGGNVVIGDLDYTDSNNVIITFTATFSGYAYFN